MTVYLTLLTLINAYSLQPTSKSFLNRINARLLLKKKNQAIQLCHKVKAPFQLRPPALSVAVSELQPRRASPGCSAPLVLLPAGLEHLPTPAPLLSPSCPALLSRFLPVICVQ